MNNINLLIVASSDMDGTNDSHNLPNDVLNITYPCNKYNGKLLKELEITTSKSPRCSKCHYTKLEHKYGYPLFPLHPVKLEVGVYSDSMGKLAGKPVYNKSVYSDLWMNKTIIFEKIKFIYGDNININYHTITETYKNDLSYLPIINNINNIIENKLKLNGKITYQEPYHFSCMLDEIYKQESYKNTLYDCIFVVSGGLGLLYTPKNFKVMKKILKKDINIPSVIGNLMYKPNIEYPEYQEQFKFMNPINSVLKEKDITMYKKRGINKCIRNYTKILLGNEFTEAYEMLFRNTKPTKTKKNIKHKPLKRTKTKS